MRSLDQLVLRMRRLAPLALLAALAAPGRAEIVDRIVAVVGNHPVTLSDVQEEHRIQCFLEGKEVSLLEPAAIKEIAGRLVNRTLMLQEMQGESFPGAPATAVDARLRETRDRYPGEAAYRAALERYGIEEEVLRRRFALESDVLRFIDYRFRSRAQVTSEDVERYYRESLLPELRKQHVREPALQEVRDKIAAVLVEQRVNELMAAWIQDLRGQATVRLR